MALQGYTSAMQSMISVSYTSDGRASEASEFARQHNLHCTPMDQSHTPLVLHFGHDHTELKDMENNASIHVDFISGALQHRRKYGGGRGQTIAKAIGLKPGVSPPRIIDATAGLAKDAFVFACLGCSVTLLERSPVVASLVEDAIQRASNDEDFKSFLNQGFKLVQTDATDYLQQLDEESQPDIIYLDPMYPERKKSAQVKKNMQLLQKLLGKDEDTAELLDIAIARAKKRVVVKRPKGAEYVANKKPTLSYESKKTRYDVYITQHG